jgi:hypothetical protein
MLEQFFASQHMRFGGSNSSLVLRGDKIFEEPGVVRDASSFAANAVSSVPSAYGRFQGESGEGEKFYLDLGFLIVAGTRIAWLEITERNLARFGFALFDRDSDPLHFLVGLFRALGASTMVMGVEPELGQCWSFFQGKLSLKEVHEHIAMTIAPSEAGAQLLLSNPATREFQVDGLRVLTVFFVGLEFYFP